MRGKKIPKTARILGVEVKIRMVGKRWMLRMTGDRTCVGAWRQDLLTVYLLEGQAWSSLVDSYLHELDHAWTDIKGWQRDRLLGG
jgi:hypothetical protein